MISSGRERGGLKTDFSGSGRSKQGKEEREEGQLDSNGEDDDSRAKLFPGKSLSSDQDIHRKLTTYFYRSLRYWELVWDLDWIREETWRGDGGGNE